MEIDDEDHAWLVKLNEDYGAHVFPGPIQAIVPERLSDIAEGRPPD